MGKRASATSALLTALLVLLFVFKTVLPVLVVISYPYIVTTPIKDHSVIRPVAPGICPVSRLVDLPRGPTFCAIPASHPILTYPVTYPNGTIGFKTTLSPTYILPFPSDHLLLVPQTSLGRQGRDRTSLSKLYPLTPQPQDRSPVRTVIRISWTWLRCTLESAGRWVGTSVALVWAVFTEVLWLSVLIGLVRFVVNVSVSVNVIVVRLLDSYSVYLLDKLLRLLVVVTAVITSRVPGPYLHLDLNFQQHGVRERNSDGWDLVYQWILHVFPDAESLDGDTTLFGDSESQTTDFEELYHNTRQALKESNLLTQGWIDAQGGMQDLAHRLFAIVEDQKTVIETITKEKDAAVSLAQEHPATIDDLRRQLALAQQEASKANASMATQARQLQQARTERDRYLQCIMDVQNGYTASDARLREQARRRQAMQLTPAEREAQLARILAQ